MSDSVKWLIVGALLAAYTVLSCRYVVVWETDLLLWQRAVERAPWKPRPRINYAQALIELGDYDEARRHIEMAETYAQLPWVREWDRRDTYNHIVRMWRGLVFFEPKPYGL